jgi:hypothetical protein
MGMVNAVLPCPARSRVSGGAKRSVLKGLK